MQGAGRGRMGLEVAVADRVAGVIWAEKRATKRYVTSLEVLFTWRGRQVRGIGVDISMTGMRFASEVLLESGTQLDAYFAAPNSVGMHQLVGRVAWSKPSPDVAELFDAGLEFSTLSKETHAELERLIRESSGDPAPDDLPHVDEAHVDLVDGDFEFSTPEPTAGGLVEGGPETTWTVAQRLDAAVADDVRQRRANENRARQLTGEAREVLRARDYDAAVTLLRQVLALVPSSPEAHEELAAALYHVGQVRESAQLFDKALRLRLERSGE